MQPQGDEATYPKLTPEEIVRLNAYGDVRQTLEGEILFDPGQKNVPVFVVLDGEIEILSTAANQESVVVSYGRGAFTGAVNMLLGRPAVVRGLTRQPSHLLEIQQADFRRMLQMDSQLGETFLRTFIMRQARLVSKGLGDVVLIGSNYSPGTLRLKQFLARNSYPHAYLDVDRDPAVQELLDQVRVRQEDIPVLICRGQTVLRNPCNTEVASHLGLNPDSDDESLYDVIVVGAGPAGLAAAVYGASEGLRVRVLEGSAPGGQAGSSSRIENYLGFPAGLSGQELTERALLQAQKFGAQIAISQSAARLICGKPNLAIQLASGKLIEGKSIIVAAGAAYRRPSISNLSRFEGAGIYYGATNVESKLCQGKEIVIVGGGNSAGQAATFLSNQARHVHLLVRGSGLSDTMSRYLIHRIEECPSITLRTFTEIVAFEGNGHLQHVKWRNAASGVEEIRGIEHVFLMTGADPNTGWLNDCLALDSKGFVKTGPDLTAEDISHSRWDQHRDPYLLESSIPRVFAVGDIRSGSVKRVASAVGEGSVAIQLVHRVLAE
jgi:thioredoxin reductase (NADPH)